ncbi:MAG: DUF4912 domain-containing protein [Elusimicrobiota bacterium]
MSDNLSSRMAGAPSFTDSYARSEGLPKNYGDTKIVILPRDPMWFYAYWEVAPNTIQSIKKVLGEGKFDSSKWVLRIYDVTEIEFNGRNAHRYFDVGISRDADNWYINAGELNRAWCVDLGLSTEDGQFVVIARSNVLMMPRQGVSPITDEQWAILQQEFERLLKLSGVDKIGKSSFDVAKLMRERWEEIVSISLPSSHIGASSWKGKAAEAKPKDFWMKADMELIIYGATEADAKLTLQGKSVQLRPDGSFSLRFYFPEGKQEYPIEAVSADGTMKRKVSFTVKRETK